MTENPLARLKAGTKQALAPVARWATRQRPRILMYHRFGPDDPRKLDVAALDQQLGFLKRHFNVCPLRDIVARLRSGAAPDPSSVALTVDDSYADFGEYAYPVFRKHGIPVTIFVVSEFASGRLWFWWDAIRYLVNTAEAGEYRLDEPATQFSLRLGAADSRNAAWSELAAISLSLAPEARDHYLSCLQDVFAITLPDAPTPEFAALDWNALQSLDPDIVEIGAHTRTHPILSQCDSDRILDEIAGSRHAIEAQLGRPVTSFCYPNGEPQDVDQRCMDAARYAGYESAVMACGGMVSGNANLFALERMSASHRHDEFASDVSGIAHLRERLTRIHRSFPS